jgi:hypothetical protein
LVGLAIRSRSFPDKHPNGCLSGNGGAPQFQDDLDKLRRDGPLVARFDSAEDAAQWRATLRRACQAAGLRVRTGLANADARIAWAHHVDHVVTEAAQ